MLAVENAPPVVSWRAFLPARRSFDFLPLFTDKEDIEKSVWLSKETLQQWFAQDTDRL